MIETISPTGARHLRLPGAGLRERGARRFKRLLAPMLLALLLAAALLAGRFLYLEQQKSGGRAPGQASTPASGPAALPKLPPPDLFRPLSPEAAQKENAARPLDAVPTTPALPFRLNADQISRLRAVDCLTQAVYYEAASEGVDGGRAVAQVVLNRMRHPGYPNSVCGVVYQGSQRVTGCQFTFTCDGALARTPVAYLWARSRLIATEALAGRVFLPVGYSTHYHADYVVPYWAASLDKVAVIGRHIFYRLRGASGSRGAFRQGYAGREPEPVAQLPTVIAESLETLENGTAPSELVELPKVEEDRIQGITATSGGGPQVEASSSLEADLSRGQLILGEAAPGATPKKKAAPHSGCNSASAEQIRSIGSTVSRVGISKPGC